MCSPAAFIPRDALGFDAGHKRVHGPPRFPFQSGFLFRLREQVNSKVPLFYAAQESVPLPFRACVQHTNLHVQHGFLLLLLLGALEVCSQRKFLIITV